MTTSCFGFLSRLDSCYETAESLQSLTLNLPSGYPLISINWSVVFCQWNSEIDLLLSIWLLFLLLLLLLLLKQAPVAECSSAVLRSEKPKPVYASPSTSLYILNSVRCGRTLEPASHLTMSTQVDTPSSGLNRRPPKRNDLKPCRLWLTGSCRYGNRCKFSHEEKPTTTPTTTNVRYSLLSSYTTLKGKNK